VIRGRAAGAYLTAPGRDRAGGYPQGLRPRPAPGGRRVRRGRRAWRGLRLGL